MRFATIFLLCLFSFPALAEGGCYDSEPVLERTEDWDLGSPAGSAFYLPTRGVFGGFETRAAAYLVWDGQLHIRFDHVLQPGQDFGLPYTVHRLEIAVGEEEPIDLDFTESCSGPGLSFFPFQVISLAPIKLRENLTGSAAVRIRIWGRL
jgi:hypothetical protein